MDLGTRIKIYRAKHNLTQAQFGEKIGVCLLTVHRAEKNLYGELTRIKIEKFLEKEGEV